MGIIFDKEALLEYVDNFQAVRDFPAPDLSGILKIDNPVLKVRGASLDDHIRAKQLAAAPMVLLATVIDKVSRGEEVDVNTVRQEMFKGGLHQNTLFEIQIFHQCVVEPKFEMLEVIRISRVIPEIINKVCTFALGITARESLPIRSNDVN